MAGGINTFGYVGGNPLRYTDPTGESATLVIAVVALCVGGNLWLAHEYLGPLLEQSAEDRLKAMDDLVDGKVGAQDDYNKAAEKIGAVTGAVGAAAQMTVPPSSGLVKNTATIVKKGMKTYSLVEKIGDCEDCPNE